MVTARDIINAGMTFHLTTGPAACATSWPLDCWSYCLLVCQTNCLVNCLFQVFKHHHEESTGRTSSIGQHNLCLDSAGGILNDPMFRNQTCGEYISKASKVVTLVDLAGERSEGSKVTHGGAQLRAMHKCLRLLGVAVTATMPYVLLDTYCLPCTAYGVRILNTNLQSFTLRPTASCMALFLNPTNPTQVMRSTSGPPLMV